MRTNTVQRTADANTPGMIHKAEIMSNAAMYNIFYNKIYTRKEMAIVRELLANAWDAMAIANNTHTPIDIHLPTLLEPWYMIRDYGTGMHPDDLVWRYMNYGNSDKNDTNDSIGGFGFGGKAPFCYTDSFSVVSYYKGTKYVFQAFIQEDGTPGCTLMHEEPTSERDGLELQVNIKDTGPSHAKFIEAMRELYPHVPTAPRLNVNPERHNFFRHEYLLDLDDKASDTPLRRIQVRESTRHFGMASDPVRFIMGIIPYEVEYSEIEAAYRAHDRDTTELQQLRKLHFDLEIDIGAAEVTASREGLEHNKVTRQAIVDTLPRAMKLASKEFEKQLDGAKTWYEWWTARRALPMAIAAPDWVKDLTHHDDERITAGELGNDMSMTTNVALFRPEGSLVDGFRRTYIDTVRSNQFSRSVVYVQPKATWPIKRFMKEKHFTSDQDKDALVIYGDIDKIRKKFKQLGIPNEVKEMEYLKAERGSSQAQRKKLGATEYQILDFNLTNLKTAHCPQNSQSKIADFMDDLDDNDALVLVNYNNTEEFVSLVQAGILEVDTDLIELIRISPNHTRVIKSLQDEYKSRVMNFGQSPAPKLLDNPHITLNEERLRDFIDHKKASTILGEDFLSFMTMNSGTFKKVFARVHPRNRTAIGYLARSMHRAHKLMMPESRGFNGRTLAEMENCGLRHLVDKFDARPEAYRRVSNTKRAIHKGLMHIELDVYEELGKYLKQIFLDGRQSGPGYRSWYHDCHESFTVAIAALSTQLPTYKPN